MNIRYLTYPTTTLGHGRRAALWLSGCPHDCPGCMSLDLKTVRPADKVPPERVEAVLSSLKGKVDGVTISGGEPFRQARALRRLVEFAKAELTDDILVYSGYTLAELRGFKSPDVDAVLDQIAVLIDGRYVAERDDGRGIRGSSNQVVHQFDPAVSTAGYETARREVQSFVFGDTVFLVGLR
jgi:anaerobic ribonucleoside-triphosphate reductase activating protein